MCGLGLVASSCIVVYSEELLSKRYLASPWGVQEAPCCAKVEHAMKSRDYLLFVLLQNLFHNLNAPITNDI